MKTSATQQPGVKVEKPWIGVRDSWTELKGPGVKVELERRYMGETEQLCIPGLSWPLTWGNEDECGLIFPGFLEHLRQNEKWRKGVGQKTRPWHREGVYCPSCGVRHWRTNVGSLWVNLFANRSTWRQNHASQTGARTAERAHSHLPVIWQATLVLSVFRRTCRPWAEGRNCWKRQEDCLQFELVDVKGGQNLRPDACSPCVRPNPGWMICEEFLLRGRHGDWHPLRDPWQVQPVSHCLKKPWTDGNEGIPRLVSVPPPCPKGCLKGVLVKTAIRPCSIAKRLAGALGQSRRWEMQRPSHWTQWCAGQTSQWTVLKRMSRKVNCWAVESSDLMELRWMPSCMHNSSTVWVCLWHRSAEEARISQSCR